MGTRIYNDSFWYVEASFQDHNDAFLVISGTKHGSRSHCHFTIKEDGTVINKQHRQACKDCGGDAPGEDDCVELVKEAIRDGSL